jgi:hypothetical protein
VSDIVVRRCTVRVVRHGGWSWGPQPRRLLDQVLAALPGLVEAHLAGLVRDDVPEDVEITEPVRIAVSLTLADLQAGRFDPLQHAAVAAGPLPPPFPATEPARAEPAIRPHRTAPTIRPHRTALEPMSPVPAPVERLTLAEFLGQVFQRGELGQFLALLPADTLEAWYRSLTTSAAQPPRMLPGVPIFPVMPAERLPGGTGHPAATATAPPARAAASAQTARSRYLREAISAIAARVRGGTSADPVASADPAARPLDRRAPAGRAGAVAAHAASSAGSGSAARPPASAVSPPAAAASAPTATVPAAAADVEVASALPFLLLGPLAQVGYLSALTPALQPAGLESQTAVFATALAYTVLGPLQRAWRRRPEDLATAAPFAGLAAPVPGPALTEFARVAAPALPALDAVITQALAEGHTEGQPLVLAAAGERAGGGLLLMDREGLFPIAWADTVAGLLPAWRMFGSPPVLVAPAAAGALRDLTAAGASFVVATPRGRGERWRRLPPHRLWTNDHDDPALARHAGGYRQAVDLAAELMQALAEDRAAVPLAASPALGRSLALAAGLGLGTLAWTLWREREPTDPLLALERFADLSARISFEPQRVRVRLPLGPRHSDLSAHGLLADLPGVPWLGGRFVEFSGG